MAEDYRSILAELSEMDDMIEELEDEAELDSWELLTRSSFGAVFTNSFSNKNVTILASYIDEVFGE